MDAVSQVLTWCQKDIRQQYLFQHHDFSLGHMPNDIFQPKCWEICWAIYVHAQSLNGTARPCYGQTFNDYRNRIAPRCVDNLPSFEVFRIRSQALQEPSLHSPAYCTLLKWAAWTFNPLGVHILQYTHANTHSHVHGYVYYKHWHVHLHTNIYYSDPALVFPGIRVFHILQDQILFPFPFQLGKKRWVLYLTPFGGNPAFKLVHCYDASADAMHISFH